VDLSIGRKRKNVATRGGFSLYGVRGKQGAGLIYVAGKRKKLL